MSRGNEYIALATSPASANGDGEDDSLKQELLPHTQLPTYRGRRGFLHTFQHRRPRLSLFLVLFVPTTILIISVTFYLWHSSNHSQYTDLNLELTDHLSDNPYFHQGDIWKHNDAVAARLSHCESLGLLRNTSLPSLRHLYDSDEEVYQAQGCGWNETTIIILTSLWFAEAYSPTYGTTGESVYAQSIISTLNANNYAYMFASLGWYNHDMRKTVELWHRHRWNVRLVILDPEQASVCWDKKIRAEQKCLKDETNPEGIEAWRLLSFWYWDDIGNPLGSQWTLSPAQSNDNYFLSYSIEPTCRRLPYLPPSNRSTPPQAYLLAKQVHYVADTPAFSWTLPVLSSLQEKLGIVVAGGMVDDDAQTLKKVADVGIKNYGKLGKMEFYSALARSFVLVGVGQPRISPSPWDALCMGVPFINPILKWDEADPWNRSKWHTQQWHMTDLNPPYVYSVHAHDLEGLETAIDQALKNPILSYIPEYMKFDWVVERMSQVVEGDWMGKAKDLLKERIKSGEGVTFEM